MVVGLPDAASAYAASNASRAPPSMSPARWIVARSVPDSTRASSVVAIRASSVGSQHELHRVVLLVAAHVHLVNHVADQEQAPAAGGLVACELGLEVGLRGIADAPRAALVGDPHADGAGVGDGPDVHRLVG